MRQCIRQNTSRKSTNFFVRNGLYEIVTSAIHREYQRLHVTQFDLRYLKKCSNY